MKKRLFITSTGTGIGKTYITCRLIKQARAQGYSIEAYKPVISGFDPAMIAESDTGLLLHALGLQPTMDNLDHLSPWRYAAPLAPSMAARLENRPLDFDALAAHSRALRARAAQIVLLEGVGGVMAPMTDRHTVLDWVKASGFAALLVVGDYLGSISHTLTALEALRSRDVPVHAVLVNGRPDTDHVDGTLEELRRWARGVAVLNDVAEAYSAAG